MESTDLNDEEFSYFLAEYEKPLGDVKAPAWGSRGIHPKDGHYISFRGYVAWGKDWEACFQEALHHYQHKPDDNEGFVQVTGLDNDTIADISKLGEKLPFIPPEQLRVLMEQKRDTAAYERFVSGDLPENTPVTILQGALAEAIQREAYEDAARLHKLISKKS